MKKIILVLFTLTLALILSSCSSSNDDKKEKVQLDSIQQDAELKDLLYNEVCFNEYKLGTKSNKTSYQHSGVVCYYINLDDYGQSLDDVDITVFEKQNFLGVSKDDLTKIGVRYGADEFNGYIESYQSLPPICHVNDSVSDDYCISTYWLIGKGITENYALIHLD